MSLNDLPLWENDGESICTRIRQTKKTIKFLLKTKNERDFLERWVDHHSQISGLDGLVIFDNGSTDPEVVKYLKSISDTACVVNFSGFHNDFHRIKQFSKLYAAVKDSTDFYSVLDTDEFFIWVDHTGSVLPLDQIVPTARALVMHDIIVGVWADNYSGYDDRFILFENNGAHPVGLVLGKSLISSRLNLQGTLCHNFQLDGVDLASARRGNIVILHMKRLLPRQRIRANIEKLRQYRFLAEHEGLDKVLATDTTQMPRDNPRQWIREIQRLSSGADVDVNKNAPLGKGHILISDTGSIRFSPTSDREKYLQYLMAPGDNLAGALLRNTRLKSPWKERKMSLSVQEASAAAESKAPAKADPSLLIKVLSRPHMPLKAVQYLRESFKSTDCYLEYGSGGSTRMAVRENVKAVYSVESDLVFGKAVRRYVSRDLRESTQFKMVKIDLGVTNSWGFPAGHEKLQSWPQYALRVWDVIKADGKTPDLILIDGRFRVACFLASLINAKAGTKILFDDYTGRTDRYRVVEKYGEPVEYIDRTALFVVPESFDIASAALDLASYVVDPR